MKKEQVQIRYYEVLCCVSSEALGQVVQKSCECPIPGNVQGQIQWRSEQFGLVKNVPAHGSMVENMIFRLLPHKPFHNSMINCTVYKPEDDVKLANAGKGCGPGASWTDLWNEPMCTS